MKKNIAYFSLVLSASLLTGCLSFSGIPEPEDDQTDEANQQYVAKAQAAYEARLKAPARPVAVKEAPGMNLFLSQTPAMGHPVCQNLAVRKEAALLAKSELRAAVGQIKDFKLVEESAPAVSVVGEGDAVAPVNYLLTYNLTAIELKENASGSLTTGLIGAHKGGKSGQLVADQKFWDAIAKVEVRLFKPDGKDCIFSFTGEGKYTKMVDQNTPVSKELVLEAVKAAVKNAMADYGVKFGPQMYVTETCQKGQFAHLSAGSKFGIHKGQKVEFFTHKIRKSVMGADEVSNAVVGRGVVGANEALVEPDGAWVRVDDYKEEARRVFRWTSARVLPDETK